MRNWKFLTNNFDQVINKLIAKEDLFKLDVYILAADYMKEGRHCFTKIMKDYNQESNINNIKKELKVFDLKEMIIKKGFYAKKKGMWTTLVAMACPSCHLPIFGSSAFLSLFGHLLVPGLYAFLSPSTSSIYVPR